MLIDGVIEMLIIRVCVDYRIKQIEVPDIKKYISFIWIAIKIS